MGLLNSALQIGRSALLSYQGALQTVGSNISSAGSPDYTRLAPQLDPLQGSLVANDPSPGAGVALTDIQRYLDEGLEGRVRLAIGGQESATARQTALAQVESFFDDSSGAGLSTQLGAFFSRFNDVQNTPEDPAIRELAVAGGASLAESLHSIRGQLGKLGEDLDGQIGDIVSHADDLAKEIAELNSEITTGEAGRRGQATALRDQRDAKLRELSQLFDVTVREEPDGSINVYVGSEALVQGGISRGLVAVTETDGGFERTSVRFADTNQQVEIRGGRLQGLMTARDQNAYGQIEALDQLAAALIQDVNRIHADGQGLTGFRDVTGSFDALATDAALDSDAAGLADRPQSGSFFMTVSDDATHTSVAYRVDVSLDGQGGGTTLDSLVSDINTQVTGVTASMTSDRRLKLTATDGFSFTFGYDGQQARADTSHVLAALGINTFFSGTDARNIAVNETVQSDPSLLAAATVFLAGDGANAGKVAELETAPSDRLDGAPIPAFYDSIANSVATNAAAANSDVQASGAVLSSLQSQKESVSGVNLDEEAIALLKYERAFQGATRFVRTVDDLLTELVSLLG
ncbi:MAG: flagellar hook-associated protein FlgK [Planctomycetota bacterium]